jgi:hypothetical protein
MSHYRLPAQLKLVLQHTVQRHSVRAIDETSQLHGGELHGILINLPVNLPACTIDTNISINTTLSDTTNAARVAVAAAV